MGDSDRRSDGELLAATTAGEAEAFAVFYRRHVRAVLAYLMVRVRRAEPAADLCAEVFASALERRERYDAERGSGRAWLLTIASSLLVDSVRRGRVEDRARRRLRMPPRVLADADIERIEELVDLERHGTGVEMLLDGLPEDQREAIVARVLDERDYPEIAAHLQCSEQVVRKRVSRGLAGLRALLTSEGRP